MQTATRDRRVQRSRSALMAAAVRLVSERGTTNVSITDLADAADVSRQLVYLHFSDRDALLVAAAADLVQRELIEAYRDDERSGVAAAARHFARHRPFYRAMLTGSCAYAMTTRLNDMLSEFNNDVVQRLFGKLDDETTADLAKFFTGGAGAIVNDWIVNGNGPDELTERLLRLRSAFAPGGRR